MRQSTARLFQPTGCGNPGCGAMAKPGGVFCHACTTRPPVRLVMQDDSDLDVHVLTLRERLSGSGRWLRRIKRYGIRSCALCERPSLPGRLYCSPSCRREARETPLRIVIDGAEDTVLGHARKRGINPSTVYRRLQLGMDPHDALTIPIDETMRRSAA